MATKANNQEARRPMNSRRKPVKVAAALAHDIVDYIMDENLQEGARLPPERQMIAETGRARSTLREALRLLETRGVIEVRQGIGGGPIVRRPRPADLGEGLRLLMMFESGSIMDLVDARAEIEVIIVARSVERITKTDLTRLEATVEEQNQHITDREYFLSQSRLFHQIINDASGSLVLSLLNQALLSASHDVFVPFDYPIQHRKLVIKSHLEIIAALRARDGAAAVAAMRRHVAQSAQRWRKLAGPLADKPLRWSPMNDRTRD